MKDDLVLKIVYYQLQRSQRWHSVYSITVHHNRLVLEQ